MAEFTCTHSLFILVHSQPERQSWQPSRPAVGLEHTIIIEDQLWSGAVLGEHLRCTVMKHGQLVAVCCNFTRLLLAVDCSYLCAAGPGGSQQRS